MSKAIEDIADERLRQARQEGWTSGHDDSHEDGELAVAAAIYAMPDEKRAESMNYWPWDRYWWKPGDRRRELVKAGALIAAEIERLDRLDQ